MNEIVKKAITELTKENIKIQGPILAKGSIAKTIGKYGIILLPEELIKEWNLVKDWKTINEPDNEPHLLFTIQKVFKKSKNEEKKDYTQIHNLDILPEELKIQMYVGDYTIAPIEEHIEKESYFALYEKIKELLM